MAIDRTNPTQVATNGAGNVLDDVLVTAASAPVNRRRQVVAVGDPDSAGIDAIARVANAPTFGDDGLVTYPMLYDASGNAIRMKSLPVNAIGLSPLPVWANAMQLATYKVAIDNIVSGALTANTRKDVLSIEHALASTKTVKVRRIVVGAYQTTALAGVVYFKLFKGTAASSGGTAVTPIPTLGSLPAAECVTKTLPTIVAATGPLAPMVAGFLTAAANTGFASVMLYDWQEGGETIPLTLRAGVLESLVLSVYSNVAMNLNVFGFVTLTEES
jgi:hypothetical protein